MCAVDSSEHKQKMTVSRSFSFFCTKSNNNACHSLSVSPYKHKTLRERETQKKYFFAHGATAALHFALLGFSLRNSSKNGILEDCSTK